jgi:hypothetical protein
LPGDVPGIAEKLIFEFSIHLERHKNLPHRTVTII